MDMKQEIVFFLDDLSIPYEYHTHPPAHTIEACLAMPFITDDVTICKNLFLCNRQQTRYYLLLLKPDTVFRTSTVSKALGSSRLGFAPEDSLPRLLHLTSGSVSPFGLLYDHDHQIVLAAENAVKDTPRIAFHPCDNTATIILAQDDFWQRVIPALGIEPELLQL